MPRISSWTEGEIEYLKRHYGKKQAQEIADDLGRPRSALYVKARQLGLSGKRGDWSEEEVKFLRKNYLILGAEECARQLGRSVSSVHAKILRAGGGRPPVGPRARWTEDDIVYLRENYQKLSWEEMEKALGRTEAAITRKANALGLKRYIDPYPFFEAWTEESAYTIGFFAADGWISKRGPESIRIGFGQKDSDILYSIKRAIGSGNVYAKQNGMHQYYIQSVRTYERLCEVFGRDVCQKCHTLQWPNIPDEYVRHFIRGAVDGDGSWHERQDGLWSFQYATSSKSFASSLVETVERMTGIHLNKGLNKIQVWHVRGVGIKAVCLADWLYRDASIALGRKAALAQQMMNHTGVVYSSSLTPKMRETFPHILSRYEVVEFAESAVQ